QGMAVVAAAGPAMNFLLAWLTALLMHATAIVRGPAGEAIDEVLTLFLPNAPGGLNPLAESFLLSFLITNLVLGLFNLIPLPPLDGGRIVVGLLPLSLAQAWARLERAGLVIVLLLIFALPPLLGEFGIAFDPIREGLNRVLPWALRVVLFLSGHPLETVSDERFL
ncbi:MAG: site-2 protease family protein, partial [Acetobacteraceae bacterium]|nr:site-2 protease family protein [Acetobacteraceae bacterium]